MGNSHAIWDHTYPPTEVRIPPLPPAEAGTRFSSNTPKFIHVTWKQMQCKTANSLTYIQKVVQQTWFLPYYQLLHLKTMHIYFTLSTCACVAIQIITLWKVMGPLASAACARRLANEWRAASGNSELSGGRHNGLSAAGARTKSRRRDGERLVFSYRTMTTDAFMWMNEPN